MKKIKTFIFVGLAALMTAVSFTACSDDDNDSVAQAVAAGNEIRFNAGIAGAQGTRAKVTTLQDLEQFGLFATLASDNSYFMGADGSPVLFSRTNGVYSTSAPYYWPTGKADSTLNFYAYAPTDAGVKTSWGTYNTYTRGGALSNATQHRILNLNYTVPTDITNQVDLLAASTLGQTKNTNNGVVNLTFNHLLSQVKFTASKPAANLEVTIESVSLIHMVSDYDYAKQLQRLNRDPMAVVIGGDPWVGTPDSRGTSEYVVKPAANIVLNSRTQSNVAIQQGSEVLMVVPQPLYYNTVEDGSVVGSTNLGMKVTCKVKDTRTGKWIIGNDASFDDIYLYVPVSLWPGKCYTFVLNFNGEGGFGYDDKGNPKTTKISTNVTVNDWDNEADKGFDI